MTRSGYIIHVQVMNDQNEKLSEHYICKGGYVVDLKYPHTYDTVYHTLKAANAAIRCYKNADAKLQNGVQDYPNMFKNTVVYSPCMIEYETAE